MIETMSAGSHLDPAVLVRENNRRGEYCADEEEAERVVVAG